MRSEVHVRLTLINTISSVLFWFLINRASQETTFEVISTAVEQLEHKLAPRLGGAFDSEPKTSENRWISSFQTLPEKRSLSIFMLMTIVLMGRSIARPLF